MRRGGEPPRPTYPWALPEPKPEPGSLVDLREKFRSLVKSVEQAVR